MLAYLVESEISNIQNCNSKVRQVNTFPTHTVLFSSLEGTEQDAIELQGSFVEDNKLIFTKQSIWLLRTLKFSRVLYQADGNEEVILIQASHCSMLDIISPN